MFCVHFSNKEWIPGRSTSKGSLSIRTDHVLNSLWITLKGQQVMKIDKRGRTRPRMTLNITKKLQPVSDFMNESFKKWKRPDDYLVFDDFIMKSGASSDPIQTTYKEKARFFPRWSTFLDLQGCPRKSLTGPETPEIPNFFDWTEKAIYQNNFWSSISLPCWQRLLFTTDWIRVAKPV